LDNIESESPFYENIVYSNHSILIGILDPDNSEVIDRDIIFQSWLEDFNDLYHYFYAYWSNVSEYRKSSLQPSFDLNTKLILRFLLDECISVDQKNIYLSHILINSFKNNSSIDDILKIKTLLANVEFIHYNYDPSKIVEHSEHYPYYEFVESGRVLLWHVFPIDFARLIMSLHTKGEIDIPEDNTKKYVEFLSKRIYSKDMFLYVNDKADRQDATRRFIDTLSDKLNEFLFRKDRDKFESEIAKYNNDVYQKAKNFIVKISKLYS
jgi:hypothetical protein